MGWTLEKAEHCCGQASIDELEVQGIIQNFSDFIIQCPVDFLEALIYKPFGRVYKLFLLERCCTFPIKDNDLIATRECIE